MCLHNRLGTIAVFHRMNEHIPITAPAAGSNFTVVSEEVLLAAELTARFAGICWQRKRLKQKCGARIRHPAAATFPTYDYGL
jgi:hypothetical protein